MLRQLVVEGELSGICGVGSKRLAAYGDQILAVLAG
jgi:hypothetical protein